jgi:hypothetical protein
MKKEQIKNLDFSGWPLPDVYLAAFSWRGRGMEFIAA